MGFIKGNVISEPTKPKNCRFWVGSDYPDPWADLKRGSPEGSLIYIIGVSKSRTGGSTFWILPGHFDHDTRKLHNLPGKPVAPSSMGYV